MTARSNSYLMENLEENIRLEVKTDPVAVRKQALWCGLKPGLRVLNAEISRVEAVIPLR